MEISVSIQGLDLAIDAFRRAPAVVQATLGSAVMDAAEIIRDEAQSRHRYTSRTSAIERSVTVRRSGATSAEVFLDRAIAPYAGYVHEGTRPHLIAPTRRSALRWTTPQGFAFARRAQHPGTRPDQFLYEAARAKQSAVEQRIQLGVDDAIQQAGIT